MENYTWWENVVLGILVLLVTFWLQQNVKNAYQRSQNIPSDWKAVILPLSCVVMLVILLIAMV